MSKVALLPCREYDVATVKKQLAACCTLIGFDMAQLRDSSVLVKPNLLMSATPARAVTTHPVFVRAAVELILDGGAKKVVLGDSPGFGNTLRLIKETGIEEALQGLPVSYAAFNHALPLKNPGGLLKEYSVAAECLECDHIINLPKIKTHTLMGLTCAVKNLYGLVVGFTKSRYHLETGRDTARFARIVTELCYLRKPTLTLVDGIVGMDGPGPGSGDPFPIGVVLAGTDPIAIDTIVSKVTGLDPATILSFEAARVCHLGDFTPELVGASIEATQVSGFRPAPGGRGFSALPAFLVKPLKEWLALRPVIDNARCERCLECVRICPPKAMTKPKRNILIDKKKCIRCFCCQEVCPAQAILSERNLIGRLLSSILK